MIDYAAARLNMVEGQLRTNKVVDPAVLDAFLSVPRERFVPRALSGSAYVDEDIPLGDGRYVMEPMVLARLLELAAIGPTDRALEIGCATGYGAALLARIASEVIALEQDARLAGEARTRLAELGCRNALVVEGKLAGGCANHAPYDVILLGGAVASLPDAIGQQLQEGGRLVAVIKSGAGLGQAVLMTRIDGVLSRRPVFDAATPLLPGFEPRPSFVF